VKHFVQQKTCKLIQDVRIKSDFDNNAPPPQKAKIYRMNVAQFTACEFSKQRF